MSNEQHPTLPGTHFTIPSILEATVTAVKGSGSRRYAVTRVHPEELSVTFSLSDWKGDREPAPGQRVFLRGVQLFVKGFRAASAEPILLQPATSNRR